MRSAILALALLLAAPAWAGPSEEVAQRAQAVHAAHCAQVASGDAALASEALVQVSPVWAEVQEVLEQGGEAWLLYWRGTLALCLRQGEVGEADLVAFVRDFGDEPAFASMVAQARRALGRRGIGARSPAPPPDPAGLIGAVLAASAGATGGLAGWQWGLSQAQAQQLYEGIDDPVDREASYSEGAQAAEVTHGLAGAAVGLGVAALAVWIVGAATRPQATAAARGPRAAAAFAPVPGGLLLFGSF